MLKVLVADDSASMHQIFGTFAEGAPIPFEVVSAHSGDQCLALLRQNFCNLAFIDVSMPGMSGMEAIGGARYEGNKTFVTLMSSTASEKRFQLARHLKVYEFLVKPFGAQEVYRIISTYDRMTVPTRALIVDDSATVRRLISKVVSGSIFNVDIAEAGDGTTALELCDKEQFNVIVLDCNMPGLDGLSTLQRMLAHNRNARVIMMTAERNEERRRKALDLGATAFLYKPFYPADVDRELHAVFNLKMPMLASVETASLV
ncbi:MAG TPA: response regulator [Xanthobacteraceae bacterium]|nr:response regulator [Xanthobacteraceae bacterium]